MRPLRHIMILASAGSGKTYALTNRFIELLARGALPERIVALTFTRKAAGEFFDEILAKLARAAQDDRFAAQLARDIEWPDLRTADFLRLLRSVVDAMHRLRLGTLDSFFARVARVFPFELGLEGEFEVLEEFGSRIERQRVLRRMFAHAGELDIAQRDFIEAFKRATFGAEEKQLAPKLDAFLDSHQERYLEAPEATYWGNEQRLWPEGNHWLASASSRTPSILALSTWVEGAPIGDRQRARWRAFLTAIDRWSAGMPIPREMSYVLEKAIRVWDRLITGHAILEFDRKKQELNAAACAALVELCREIVGGEMRKHLATTRGIHAVLAAYDSVYHDIVRRAGKLTFGDVQRLLLPQPAIGRLSRRANEDGRLFIDYRLDSEIDHWLLDEFQDTSFGQWSVLQGLIDEVMQDTAGTRSFFCVGDVKQAIFAWREGDPALFREIYHHYNSAAPDMVVAQQLTDSWRSGPAVIAMVNAVFGDPAVIADLFPGPAATVWNREWRTHTSAVPDRLGQAALLVAEDEEDRWRITREILQEIRPIERGLTCAVLVPKNTIAAALADFLRAADIPAVAESDLHVCTDNPVGASLLALMQAAAHPGDTLSWEHVQMTPLGAVLAEQGIGTREAATLFVLRQIHREGFEATVAHWLRKLELQFDANDAFNRTRARQFASAAAAYDRTGSRSVAEFVQFMERHVVRDAESTGVVRVMTVHKSKGLGFDVVILPDLQGKRLDIRRDGLAVQKADDRSVKWILELPPRIVCDADDVLSRHVRSAEADACYEALSLLYVALTRAKRANYVIIEDPGQSASRNYPRLVTATLAGEPRDIQIGGLRIPGSWAQGDDDWHVSLNRSAAATRPTAAGHLSPLEGADEPSGVRRAVRRPSGEMAAVTGAAQLFSLDAAAAADHGAEVHALLATFERTGGDVRKAGRIIDASKEAIEEASAVVRASALTDIWSVSPRAEIWRERAFEILLDGNWVTGVFDRVVVDPVKGVHVIDFKTDRVDEHGGGEMHAAARRHQDQLNTYRRVAAVLAGVPIAGVTCEIVLTRTQQRVPVLPP